MNDDVRLLAFPHAGAGASSYRDWSDLLGPGIRLVPIRLPGRETRFTESPAESVGDMIAATEDQWLPNCRPPYAVLGHSVGALAAFELAREIRRRRLPPPVRLVVLGRVAPQETSPAPRFSDLPDDQLVGELVSLGGPGTPVLGDPDLRRMLLPVVRADLRCDEDYRYRPEPPLTVPLIVLGGASDPRAPWPGLARWEWQANGPCVFHIVPGDHFFVHHRRAEVVRYVRAALESWPEEACW